ncbi:MAG: ABC transporter ATP-binding protein [Clostridiales bacterium]|jgi:ABC-2 type transport system ATP-binding protein|nr:ABC transporter ATP-binding protein [Clostridiales bacterium]MDR2750754.1 ABC transporter ATP-binding protein [Clostridiales bacterium]
MKAVIELEKLTKSYGKQRGIKDVTFTVNEGETFGFIGPNGAGKSTTIRTLLALFEPTGGHAKIFGMDCVKQASEIARDVGYVPSEAAYYDKMKVKELLSYTGALYKKDCKKKADALCDKLGLDQARRISDLSFGNKKKVGIVAALLHSPKLIILDEPTAGLDPLVQQTFFEILGEENKRGATVFFSSHILSEVQKFCQRVAILKEGILIGVQGIKELRETGYKKVSITAKEDIPADYFKTENAAQLAQSGAKASFIYKGDVGNLFNRIAKLGVEDAFVEEPSLEEIFLHYYE